MELTFEAGGWWAYVAVFVAAAIPVLEVLVVIPAAVVAGLAPVPTAVVALAGNLSTVALVAVAGDRLLVWWRRRRGHGSHGSGRDAGASDGRADQPSRRSARARDLAQRFGVPGLALLAPLTTGTHIATVAALATGSRTSRVLAWMAAGLVVWSAIVAAAAAGGLELFA